MRRVELHPGGGYRVPGRLRVSRCCHAPPALCSTVNTGMSEIWFTAARPTTCTISAAPLQCSSLRHPAPSSSQFCTHDILLFGHAPPTRVSASPLPRLPPGSHAATAAPGCALLELARAARPGRGSMSCLRSVPVCVVAIVVVYVKERDTHT